MRLDGCGRTIVLFSTSFYEPLFANATSSSIAKYFAEIDET